MRTVPYPTPGEILLEEFLKPMEISQYRLAKEIGVPARRIGGIVAGKRAVTADTGLRLSAFFGTSEGFWTGLQDDYDRAVTKSAIASTLKKITPWPQHHAAKRGRPRASSSSYWRSSWSNTTQATFAGGIHAESVRNAAPGRACVTDAPLPTHGRRSCRGRMPMKANAAMRYLRLRVIQKQRACIAASP